MRDHRRAPSRQENTELQGYAFKWMARLPGRVRPLQVGRQYPRIANRLAMIWADPQIAEIYFKDLIAPKREGRQGFPEEIISEINRLYLYFLSGLETQMPDKPWMEPGHEDRPSARARM